MKKFVPVLVVLALVVVGGLGYFMGQQSNAPAAETPPAESSTPEVTPDTTPEVTPTTPAVETTFPEPTPETVEHLQGDELTTYFQQVYDLVMEQQIPQEYRLQTELLYLPDMNESGKELPADYEAQYVEWRPEDEAAEPESEIPEETQQPSNPQPSNPQPSNPPSGGDSGVSGDSDGNGIPDIFEGQGTSTPGHNSDHTDKEAGTGENIDTDHDYSGITIGTGSNNQGISGGNSSVDANGDGFPDSWQMEDPGSGNGGSNLTDKDIEGGSNTDHDYSGITIG